MPPTPSSDIDGRGRTYHLEASGSDPGGREKRLDRIRELFTALAPVLRPLAVQVEYAWRDLVTSAESDDLDCPDDALIVLAEDPWPADVALSPRSRIPLPITRVPSLSPDSLRALVASRGGEFAGAQLDWFKLRTIAVALRTSEPVTALLLGDPSEKIDSLEPGWFAGPRGLYQYDAIPPVDLELRSDHGDVDLRMTVHWTRWYDDGPDNELIWDAVRDLETLGWSRP